MQRLRSVFVRWPMVIAGVLAIIFLTICSIVHLDAQRVAMNQQEMEKARVSYQLKQEKKALEKEIASIETKGYLEKTARSDWGYIKEGEMCFTVINPEALGNYTSQETQILSEELSLDDALQHTENLIYGAR